MLIPQLSASAGQVETHSHVTICRTTFEVTDQQIDESRDIDNRSVHRKLEFVLRLVGLDLTGIRLDQAKVYGPVLCCVARSASAVATK